MLYICKSCHQKLINCRSSESIFIMTEEIADSVRMKTSGYLTHGVTENGYFLFLPFDPAVLEYWILSWWFA